MNNESIPASLQAERRWVVWKNDFRNGQSIKVPYQTDGKHAKSNDSTGWTTYDEACKALLINAYDGVGFMLGDGFAGVDLDDCIADDGQLSPEAAGIVAQLDSYTEVSPSGRGLKVFVRGKMGSGRRGLIDNAKVELYAGKRFFTVTGERYGDTPKAINDAQPALDDLLARVGGSTKPDGPKIEPHWPDVPDTEHLAQYRQQVEQLPMAVSGQNGSDATFHAACVIRRFGLNADDSWQLFQHYNDTRCEPPWDASINHGPESLQRKFREGCGRVVTEAGKGNEPPVSWAPSEVDFADHLTTDTNAADTNSRPKVFRFIGSDELDTGSFEVEELIKQTLVARQPLIIAGPQKSMKTGLVAEGAISLATGTPMLGRLKVHEPVRVAVMTGESGFGTIQETARRIAASKGRQLADIAGLFWCDKLPRFGDVGHAVELAAFLKGEEITVLFVDPAYLAMPGSDAANLMAQGELLAPMKAVCDAAGTTFALAHHTKRHTSEASSNPLGLSDIAWAGFPEFAGQWWLINRRERYKEGTGDHRLWLSVGSRVGFSAAWALTIREGVWSPSTPRRWDVDLQPRADHETREQEIKRAESAMSDSAKVVQAMRDLGQPESKRVIAEKAKLSNEDTGLALKGLQSAGSVSPVSVKKGNGQYYDCYKLAEPPGEDTVNQAA